MRCKVLILAILFLFPSIFSNFAYADFEKFMCFRVWCPDQVTLELWISGSDEVVLSAFEKYDRTGKLVDVVNDNNKTIWCAQKFLYTSKELFFENPDSSKVKGWITYDIDGNITGSDGLKSEHTEKVWDEDRVMLFIEIDLKLVISKNKYYYGDNFNLKLELENKGFDFVCDIYLVMSTPDGRILFFPKFDLEYNQPIKDIKIPYSLKVDIDLLNIKLPSFSPPISENGFYQFAIGFVDPVSGHLIENTFDKISFSYLNQSILK